MNLEDLATRDLPPLALFGFAVLNMGNLRIKEVLMKKSRIIPLPCNGVTGPIIAMLSN